MPDSIKIIKIKELTKVNVNLLIKNNFFKNYNNECAADYPQVLKRFFLRNKCYIQIIGSY